MLTSYVFCYFEAIDYSTANLLDLEQWEFFAFTKKHIINLLNGRKSISLKYLQEQGIKSLKANELEETIKHK